MGKIKIEFTLEEIVDISHLIQENQGQIPQYAELLKKITDAQSDSDKRGIINTQIKGALFRLTGIAPNQIEDTAKLVTDPLLMTAPQIKSLAIPFTKIAKQYKENAMISMDECIQLTIVQSCVELIMGKIK